MKHKNDIKICYYICGECAKKREAVWPAGHEATWHIGVCDDCGKEKGVCSIDDWDWPKGLHKHFSTAAGRD